MKKIVFLILSILLLNTSCRNNIKIESNKDKTTFKMDVNSINCIISKRIYFGHMSVGRNILNGVSRIVSNNNLNIQIIDTINSDYLDVEKGFLYHTRIGENGKPSTKINDFKSKIEEGLYSKIDIAFFKFCYVDFKMGTDVKKVFDMYSKTMDSLSLSYPNTLFVHTTVPLRKIQSGFKASIKKIVGKSIGIEDNIVRNEFNKMLKSKYQNIAPIFDIALFESTRPDGEREYIETDEDTCYNLVPEYTFDGGHLNIKGEDYLASQLLIFLSQICK